MLSAILVRPKKWPFIGVCALLGIASFFVIYGVRTLDVSNESWIWPAVPEGDVVQNYAGWMAYRESPWTFPLAGTDRVCWPDGTLIAYMDSNPLLSAVLKLLSPVLPGTFVVYGWFTLVCFALQGVAAGLLAKLYATKAWQAYVAVPLFTFAPILMERSFRHIQMAAQFLILFALYFAIRMRREGYKTFYWQFLLLNILAVGMFPYFLPMVMALLFVAMTETAIHRRSVWKPLGFLALNAGTALAVGFVLGVIGWDNSNYSRGGYGYFSMNLNAPFNPNSLGDYRWSWVLSRLPQHSGQYDGFNYLGLGILLFLAFVVLDRLFRVAKAPGPFWPTLWKAGVAFAQKHAVMLAVCAVLTGFAVSNTVVLNGRTLFEIPLPSVLYSLFGIFRASGRLFYPVVYVLYLFVLRYVLVRFSARGASALVCLLVCVQLLDLSGVVVQKHRYFANPPVVETPLSDPVLADGTQRCDILLVADDSIPNHYYTALAAKNGMKTNTRHVNSGYYPLAEAAGEAGLQTLLAGRYDAGTLYMLANEDAQVAVLQAFEGDEGVLLYEYDGYLFVIPQGG